MQLHLLSHDAENKCTVLYSWKYWQNKTLAEQNIGGFAWKKGKLKVY